MATVKGQYIRQQVNNQSSLMRVITKCKYLRAKLWQGQIVMARQMGQSISKTGLVECSC